MGGELPLATGLGLAALVALSWLGGIVYLRRMRRALQTVPAGGRQDRLARTADDAHSIETWLARAAALPEGSRPRAAGDGPRDQARLAELAARHFPHLAVPHPHLHLIGITGLEKRLLAWVSQHTGLPNPFDALDRLTGDPDELQRAVKAWQASHADLVTVIDRLCTGTARLHEEWTGEPAGKVFPLLAEYLSELDALAADVRATAETLRALQAEAALAEGTIAGLINLLLGSLGGYLVEAVLSVGTMTPAVAAQAQVELTWVVKQIALALGRLQAVYSDTRRILASVTGFKDLERARARFQLQAAQRLEGAIDAAG